MNYDGILQSYTLEDDIETNIRFDNELRTRTLGRADWLTTRSMAEFVLKVTDSKLGLTVEQQIVLIEKVEEIVDDFLEFIVDGIDCDDDPESGDYHPDTENVAEHTDYVYDTLDNLQNNVGVGDLYDGMYMLNADDIIRMLKNRKKELKQNYKNKKQSSKKKHKNM